MIELPTFDFIYLAALPPTIYPRLSRVRTHPDALCFSLSFFLFPLSLFLLLLLFFTMRRRVTSKLPSKQDCLQRERKSLR
jgi:hypothetical protein